LSFAESALLASTALTIAVAQETQEGAQEQIIKKPATNSAMVAAPGQQQKSGDTTAREATPANSKNPEMRMQAKPLPASRRRPEKPQLKSHTQRS
jgi:hypothetical protein